MKALEKDRSRRYDSPSAMAQDIGRHLGHEPVAAGPPTAIYRLRKYLRRHTVGVSAGSAVAAALLIGLVLAWLGYQNAKDHRDQSIRSEERTKDVLAQSLFEQARSVQLAGGMGQRLRSLELLAESLELLRRERRDLPGGSAPHPGSESVEIPELRDVRSAVLDSLIRADSRQLGASSLPRSVDGGFYKSATLSTGSRFLLEMDVEHSSYPGDGPRQLRVFDLDRGQEVRTYPVSHFDSANPAPYAESFSLGPTGRLLAVLSWRTRENLYEIWDLTTGKRVDSLRNDPGFGGVLCGMFSPTARYFAAILGDAAVWDLEAPVDPRRRRRGDRSVKIDMTSSGGLGSGRGLRFDADEQLLACSRGSAVSVFDLSSRDPPGDPRLSPTSPPPRNLRRRRPLVGLPRPGSERRDPDVGSEDGPDHPGVSDGGRDQSGDIERGRRTGRLPPS